MEKLQQKKLTGKQIISFGKALSKVLRHSAEEEGIIIRPDGFMLLNDVLQVHYIAKFNATLADVQGMVASNAKQRYELKENPDFEGQYLIRAVQGHSIKTVQDEELLTKLSEDFGEADSIYSFVSICHGTYKEVLKPILENGMCRMSRNNIHFAPGLMLPGTNDVISGMRNSCQMVVDLNLTQSAVAGGVPWYISKNQVVLTPGMGDKGIVDPKYIRSIFDSKTKEFFYQQPIDYICVYDFECNCSEDRNELKFNEIIEFPVVIVDVKNKAIKSVFHTYIKTTVEPVITPFCTELTGITNDMVSKEGNPTIEQAIKDLHAFLKEEGLFNHEFVFASCGDFDGRQI